MEPVIKHSGTNAVMSAVTTFNQMVFLSGQVPNNVTGDIVEQTCEVLEKIDSLLQSVNSDKSLLLSAQLYLKNLSDFEVVNNIWIDWLDGLATPARATIQADLVNPNWLIEIAVTAVHR
ncbi:RidA family protein [Acinetobacter baumannii]|uniref:RidA family protein n=1 Tax=Acinetobacter baumannii TaxID=470 RepID=UPI00244AB5A3|nr:RidA family protein [Acinetobacter baumannii]MDH2528310.1 RidA family protein [Acinetobacter baumannii]